MYNSALLWTREVLHTKQITARVGDLMLLFLPIIVLVAMDSAQISLLYTYLTAKPDSL